MMNPLMCLAVPLEIAALLANGRALVRQGRGTLEVDVSLLEAPRVGDYVLVHAGFAIEVLDPEAAADSLRELEALDEGPAAGAGDPSSAPPSRPESRADGSSRRLP